MTAALPPNATPAALPPQAAVPASEPLGPLPGAALPLPPPGGEPLAGPPPASAAGSPQEGSDHPTMIATGSPVAPAQPVLAPSATQGAELAQAGDRPGEQPQAASPAARLRPLAGAVGRSLRHASLLLAAGIGVLTVAKVWLLDDLGRQAGRVFAPPGLELAAAGAGAATFPPGDLPAMRAEPENTPAAHTLPEPRTAPEPRTPPAAAPVPAPPPVLAQPTAVTETPERPIDLQQAFSGAVALAALQRENQFLRTAHEEAERERELLRESLGRQLELLRQRSGDLERALAQATGQAEQERQRAARLAELLAGLRAQLLGAVDLDLPAPLRPSAEAGGRGGEPGAAPKPRRAEAKGSLEPTAAGEAVRAAVRPAPETRPNPERHPDPPAATEAAAKAAPPQELRPAPAEPAGPAALRTGPEAAKGDGAEAVTLIGLTEGLAVVATADGRSLPVKPGERLPNGARLESIDIRSKVVRTSRGEVGIWQELR